jgi:hypothetical protein
VFSRNPLILVVLVLVMASAFDPAQAAVIFSSCPVESQITGEGKVDRFRADSLRSALRNYSQDVPRLGRYLLWLLSSKEALAVNKNILNENEQQLREIGRLVEDIQFASTLVTDEGNSCQSEAGSKTLPFAIFPFVMRNRDSQGTITYRVRYKVCEYYVDQKRQLPIENACQILGREEGYTFAELEARFTQLKARVEEAREVLKVATYGVGAIGSLTAFKFLRGLKVGQLSAAVLSLLPAGGAYWAVESGLSDELIRNMIDFKDAAEVAITGDLGTTVKVDMPIQDFVPFFARYLDAVELTKP